MITLKKSHVPNEHAFVRALDDHKARLKEWQDHMRRVDGDALNDKIHPKDKHAAYPPPVADTLIVAVINDGGSYTIHDDTPTSEERLVEQKEQFTQSLNTAQTEAMTKVVSPAKRTINSHREQAIMAADVGRVKTIKSKLLNLMGYVIGKDQVENARSPEDAQFMIDQAARREKLHAIVIKGAQARSDIEDLTVDTVKSWKNPEF